MDKIDFKCLLSEVVLTYSRSSGKGGQNVNKVSTKAELAFNIDSSACLDEEQKIAVGTEFNMVNRLRTKNTYILSSTKPECPTMNETTLEDVYKTLKSIKDDNISKENEIFVSEETAKWAKVALERMFEV